MLECLLKVKYFTKVEVDFRRSVSYLSVIPYIGFDYAASSSDYYLPQIRSHAKPT